MEWIERATKRQRKGGKHTHKREIDRKKTVEEIMGQRDTGNRNDDTERSGQREGDVQEDEDREKLLLPGRVVSCHESFQFSFLSLNSLSD